MRVTLVISSLGGGGAERVLTTLANYWAAQGWPVTVVTIADTETEDRYEVDPRVTISPLSMRSDSGSLSAAIKNNLGRARALRKAIRESNPDGVIAFMTENNILTRLASFGLRRPVVVSERIVYRRSFLPLYWRLLRPVAYYTSNAVVMQTRDSIIEVPRILHSKVRVIPNPVPPGPTKSIGLSPRKTLVAMGRLSPEKGFDRLLDIFAKLAPKHPDWDLIIWGDGPLRTDLTDQRDRLGLAERVSIPGRTSSPREELAKCDLFVLASHREGFPNALCEALATGLPVVSFACPFGPSDIVRHEVDGLLVPADDVDGLMKALDRMMGDEASRQRFGAEAVSIVERYALPNVAAQWEALLTTN